MAEGDVNVAAQAGSSSWASRARRRRRSWPRQSCQRRGRRSSWRRRRGLPRASRRRGPRTARRLARASRWKQSRPSSWRCRLLGAPRRCNPLPLRLVRPRRRRSRSPQPRLLARAARRWRTMGRPPTRRSRRCRRSAASRRPRAPPPRRRPNARARVCASAPRRPTGGGASLRPRETPQRGRRSSPERASQAELAAEPEAELAVRGGGAWNGDRAPCPVAWWEVSRRRFLASVEWEGGGRRGGGRLGTREEAGGSI